MRVTDRQTDRRTDGQNYDSQDRASIAASRGKNEQGSCDWTRPFHSQASTCCGKYVRQVSSALLQSFQR